MIDNPIIGRRRVDTEQEKIIKIGDKLPQDYEEPLRQLGPVAPPIFQEQARRVAYYMHALDQGLELIDQGGNSLGAKVNKFANDMAKLPSIYSVYDHYANYLHQKEANSQSSSSSIIKSRRVMETLSPQEALPVWITTRIVTSQERPKHIDQIGKFYETYANSHGTREDLKSGSKYYYYDESVCPPKGESPVDFFKCYLEEDVPNQRMEALFKDLAEQKIHPHSSKLFEGDRIVLYWDTFLSDELRTRLRVTFEEHNIPYRGFGQDSMEVNINNEGGWKFEVHSSNDKSRGEAGGEADFSKNIYTPRRFFELYLQQMMKYCRNPLDSYRMSFVPIIGESNTLKNREGLRQLLKQIEEKGLNVIWYKDGVPIMFE